MSDLHRAVQAEILAHAPSTPPSFDAMKARHRSRHRRRTAAAVAASALAAAGIAFGPSALGGAAAPAQVAGEPSTVAVLAFHVSATDPKLVTSEGGDGHDEISRCMDRPGLRDVATLFSYPGQWSGRVVGQDNADALAACVRDVPGWGVVFSPIPGLARKTYTVRPAARTVLNSRVDEQREACFALPGVEAVDRSEGRPVIYKVMVGLGAAPAFEQCIGKVLGLYVPELDPQAPAPQVSPGPPGRRLVWTGVQVCRSEPERGCLTLDGEAARELDALLSFDTARPADPAVIYDCIIEPRDYTIQFQHPSVRTVPIVVPDACEPMRVGEGRAARVLEVSQAARDAVRSAHFDGVTSGSHVALTVTQQRFVERCLGGKLPTAGEAPGYAGRSEGEIESAQPPAIPPRLVGRDAECLAGDDDRRDDRVNLVVEAGRVIWAGRF